MYVADVDGRKYEDEVFEDELIISDSRNISLTGCTFNKRIKLHINGEDIENITLKDCVFKDKFQISYFGDTGIANNILVDGGLFEGAFFQIFYADYEAAIKADRRTTGLVLRNIESYRSTHAPFILNGAIGPVLEHIKAFSPGNAPLINSFQISGCKHPVLRHLMAFNNKATGIGDGDGIILDWSNEDDLTEDALVEHCISAGNTSTPNSSGINNYRALRTIIRNNTVTGNNIGMKFAKYDDFHAYKNINIGNARTTLFWDGASNKGYA